MRKHLKHLGSTLTLLLGGLATLAAIGNVNNPEYQGDNDNIVLGLMMIVAGLAYRSAKQRFLGEVPSTKGRRILEALAMVFIVLLVVLHNDLKYHLYTNPFVFSFVPIWALIAYTIVGFRSPRKSSAADVERFLQTVKEAKP